MNITDIAELTKPKSKKITFAKEHLAAGRYGSDEMCRIWGADQKFETSLGIQGLSSVVLSELHPDIVPRKCADEIFQKANLSDISADRIRELEEKSGHDVIAINTSLEEVVSKEAGSHVHKAKTSADVTEPATAVQLRDSLRVIIDSTENIRDIMIEKSVMWKDIPHMDLTHKYDALPTVLGRPFSFYAEMLESDLTVLKFAYDNSLVGKWSDATGNHHSAKALGIDGIRLQEEFCKRLGIKYMDACAQVPGIEFQSDVMFAIARLGATLSNIAQYVADGRSDDINIFTYDSPKKKKGSSAMPHKDAKNGNPTAEEQTKSLNKYLIGNLMTAMMNCEMPYARDLSASANSRINMEDGFKFADHVIRRLADVIFYLKPNEERCKERVLRSYGVVTSQLVMTYLTDARRTTNPMTRSEAHDLMGELATKAFTEKTPFIDVLLQNQAVTSRLDEQTLREISDPLQYIGESKNIIDIVAFKYHKKKTL